MNISQRLRTCARHTGLDAVIELLNEAADEIERLSGGQPPLPTLRPGDSHMESLIEAAIQGHADTRDAMRWLARQLVPAQATQAEVTDAQIESEFQRCGGKWDGNQWVIEDADLHPFARTILALRPVQAPMSQDEVIAAIKAANISSSTTFWSIFEAGIRAAEARHGITAQAKKEGA